MDLQFGVGDQPSVELGVLVSFAGSENVLAARPHAGKCTCCFAGGTSILHDLA